MNLYLLRHGDAQAHAINDSARELTDRGREEVGQVARQFADRKIKLDCCFSSPYIRATQTTHVFLSQAGQAVAPEITAVLIPEVRAREVMSFLADLQYQEVLLVSHNPLVSELFALLTEGNITNIHILGTSELVCIAIDTIGMGGGTCPFRLLPAKPDTRS